LLQIPLAAIKYDFAFKTTATDQFGFDLPEGMFTGIDEWSKVLRGAIPSPGSIHARPFVELGALIGGLQARGAGLRRRLELHVDGPGAVAARYARDLRVA